MERRLDWDGCLNVRDLGGHPTEDGGETRMGAVVRADSVRRLTDAGWQSLVEYGIRRIVDLRLASELEEDAPGDTPVEVVHVSFLEDVPLDRQIEIFQRWIDAPDDVSATRDGYLEMLDSYRKNVAAAVAAVAGAPEGGVLIHCMGGKDRTGLVAALLLRLAGVPAADIAADYGLSAENIKPLWQEWVEDAADENGARATPPAQRVAGRCDGAGARDARARARERPDYLLDAGVSQEELELVRSRITS